MVVPVSTAVKDRVVKINQCVVNTKRCIYLYIFQCQTPAGDLDICASSCRNISKAKHKEGVGL